MFDFSVYRVQIRYMDGAEIFSDESRSYLVRMLCCSFVKSLITSTRNDVEKEVQVDHTVYDDQEVLARVRDTIRFALSDVPAPNGTRTFAEARAKIMGGGDQGV